MRIAVTADLHLRASNPERLENLEILIQQLLAERIKEIAAAHGVPIYENKPLARSLFDLVEAGEAIPESLYKAVAEILSYVYRLRGQYPGAAQQQQGVEGG